ncbi:avidin/streptavidin family protein [Legionella gresilensis]|uniref:avidin/streptavidin family protein n=1 Tax=Legionella gresilensis TaxID=91823 RepID=UPI001F5FCF0F|nr:avidin/streptavidin family protein [Legionella gresilensis]
MKAKFLNPLLITFVVVSQPTFGAQNVISFKNERGSILQLSMGSNNKIEGYFTTAVASKTCPQAINVKRPITGFMIGNAITVSIAYPMCESVLSLSGNFDKNKQTLDTISILNKQAENITQEGPGARFIGHDFYKRLN